MDFARKDTYSLYGAAIVSSSPSDTTL